MGGASATIHRCDGAERREEPEIPAGHEEWRPSEVPAVHPLARSGTRLVKPARRPAHYLTPFSDRATVAAEFSVSARRNGYHVAPGQIPDDAGKQHRTRAHAQRRKPDFTRGSSHTPSPGPLG